MTTNTTPPPKPVDLFTEESTNITEKSTKRNYNWLKQEENELSKPKKKEINSWYEKCEPYLDGNFINAFPIQFHARWWELFLCNYFGSGKL